MLCFFTALCWQAAVKGKYLLNMFSTDCGSFSCNVSVMDEGGKCHPSLLPSVEKLLHPMNMGAVTQIILQI